MTLVDKGTCHQAWQPSSIFGTNMVEKGIGSYKFSSVFHMHVVASSTPQLKMWLMSTDLHLQLPNVK